MRGALAGLFGATLLGGVGLMAYGYRRNRKEGTKRYRPGDRFINLGLAVIVVSGLLLAGVAATGGPS